MYNYLGSILVFQAMVSMCANQLSNEKILSACICSDFVNENGFGKCKKIDSDFGGMVSCYVNLPTTCTDLVQSGSNPEKYLSAEACDNEKETKLDKIIRGNEVRPWYKYPYQAFYAAGGYKCGGTVIGRRHVLTADHCIKGRTPNSQTYVIVGEHRITSNDAYGPRPEAIFGSNLIRVKRFIRRSGRNREDIGILELARDIQWSNRIQPACIPVRGAEDYVGRDSVVSGWGGTVQYNPGQNVYQRGSEVLLETTLRVQSPTSALCQKAYASAPHKLCAYREGHDTCQGDSGGPMAIEENGKFVVIGVTSSGQGCGARGHAGIYTRVSHFHNWIKENVRDVCTPQTFAPTVIPTTVTINDVFDPAPTQKGCSCSDFVNKNGYGICKRQDSDFGGLISCYVNLPSTCTDLVQSGSNPGKYLSAKACIRTPASSISSYTPQTYSPSSSQLPSGPSMTVLPYTPWPYSSSSQLPSGPSVTVRCGTCQTWDFRWCRSGEIQLAETCGKCPTDHGWFYCGGEFNDCRITRQGGYRTCEKMGSFKQLAVN